MIALGSGANSCQAFLSSPAPPSGKHHNHGGDARGKSAVNARNERSIGLHDDPPSGCWGRVIVRSLNE